MIFNFSERNELNNELAAKPVPFMLRRKISTLEIKGGEIIEVGDSEVMLLKIVAEPSIQGGAEPFEKFYFKTKLGQIFMLPESVALRQVIGLQEIVDKLTKEYESRAFSNAAKTREETMQKAEAADKAVVENSINEQSLTNWGNW